MDLAILEIVWIWRTLIIYRQ